MTHDAAFHLGLHAVCQSIHVGVSGPQMVKRNSRNVQVGTKSTKQSVLADTIKALHYKTRNKHIFHSPMEAVRTKGQGIGLRHIMQYDDMIGLDRVKWIRRTSSE